MLAVARTASIEGEGQSKYGGGEMSAVLRYVGLDLLLAVRVIGLGGLLVLLLYLGIIVLLLVSALFH